jgi:hypothetical protein
MTLVVVVNAVAVKACDALQPAAGWVGCAAGLEVPHSLVKAA